MYCYDLWGRKAARFILVLLIMILTPSCLIIPIEYGPGLSEQTVEELFQPGKTTRADVLLTLGAPSSDWSYAIDDEKFFFYHWERFGNYTMVLTSPYVFGIPPVFWAGPLSRYHYHLGIEFASDHVLKRYKYFHFPLETLKDLSQDYAEYYAYKSSHQYVPNAIRDWVAETTDGKAPD